ncbi:energy transducer TonB [Zoogloea sp.]|uniref:energy transducer TonB n=1 Tax=Zoogloea sp. TaxID=49181 RepID=UPI001415E777|nr:MAG: energy transducer TonB [Zoogloea sp.]
MTLALSAQAPAATDQPVRPAVLPRAGLVSSGLRRNSTGVGAAILLHLGVLVAIIRSIGESSPPVVPPQPLMAISLVTQAEDKPAPAPRPVPAKVPEKTVQKTVQPRTPPAPRVDSNTRPVITSAATASNPVETTASAPAAPVAAAAPAPAREAPVAVVAPRFDAAYLANPIPEYPRLSRRMGEEGRVMLRVHVGADGKPLEVTIAKSSGYPRLDDVARDTVLRSWRFVPARQGDQAVAGTVRVPIDFTLDS